MGSYEQRLHQQNTVKIDIEEGAFAGKKSKRLKIQQRIQWIMPVYLGSG